MRVFKSLYYFDLRMLLWCEKSHYQPHFMRVVRLVSKSGDGGLQLLIPLLMLFADTLNGWAFFQLALCSFLFERSLYYILKNTLKRKRPPQVIPHFRSVVRASDEFSFPSGHTMAAFLLAGLCFLNYGGHMVWLYLWATSVGISRVVLGVHFPSDIVAGALLGTTIAFLFC
jgi:undecaprenyl-diphosphatase